VQPSRSASPGDLVDLQSPGRIKTARYYELTANDVIFTVFTDSADMYKSRLAELTQERGAYASLQADAIWKDRSCISGPMPLRN